MQRVTILRRYVLVDGDGKPQIVGDEPEPSNDPTFYRTREAAEHARDSFRVLLRHRTLKVEEATISIGGVQQSTLRVTKQ